MKNKYKVIIIFAVAAILGGVKLRYMGKQLDSSLKTKLDRFAAGLAKTVV